MGKNNENSSEDAEFEEAFNEFAGVNDGTESDNDSSSEASQPSETDSTGDTNGDTAAADDQGDVDKGSEVRVETDGDGPDVSSSAGGDDTGKAGDDDQEGDQNEQKAAEGVKSAWDEMPEDLRNEHFKALNDANAREKAWHEEKAKLEHSAKSNSERVQALQRKYEGGNNDDDQGVAIDEEAAVETLDDLYGSDEWKDNDKIYPEMAGMLKKAIGIIQRQTEAKFEPLIQKNANDSVDREMEALTKDHPAWYQTVTSKEFTSWLNTQPGSIQQMMETDSAENYNYLLQSYQRVGDAAIDEIVTKRKANLAKNQNIESKGPTPKPGVPDDFDSAFDFYAKQRDSA